MADNILVGAGAGVAGLLVGLMFGGTDEDAIVKAVSAKVDAGVETSASAGSEQLAAMGAQITELKSALAGLSESQSATTDAMNGKLEAAVQALTSRIDAVSGEVGAVVEESGATQTASIKASLSGGFESLGESISGLAALATSAAAATADEPETTEDAASTVPEEPEIEGVKVGEMENLLDGKARIFVSGMDEAAKTARVAINGLSLQTLGQYSDLSFNADGSACSLKLDDIVSGHVQMSASCDE